jgi:hypothetical protein
LFGGDKKNAIPAKRMELSGRSLACMPKGRILCPPLSAERSTVEQEK